MMDYFLVNMPIVNSNDTQKLVLSLKNAEGYSNFKVSVKSDGTSFDMEATSQEGNLVEFSCVFLLKKVNIQLQLCIMFIMDRLTI